LGTQAPAGRRDLFDCWFSDGFGCAGVKGSLRRPAAALDPGLVRGAGVPKMCPEQGFRLFRICELVYDSGVFEQLGEAIEGLDIAVDGDALAAVLALRDRLDARISSAVAAHDRAGLWELDGATSMTAWLVDRAAMPRSRAAATTSRARKLAHLPLTAGAWRDGVLSTGQVEAIASNLDSETLGLFAEHEAVLVPTLGDLAARDVAIAMRAWSECATADRDPVPEAPHHLHLSRTLAGRWRLDADLGSEAGELVATALRVAQAPDADDEPARSAATRRADALADVCRFFLDHQRTRRAGRHRPHINLVLDIEHFRALGGAGAATVDGTGLDRRSVERLLCDAALHRVLTRGRSAVLDYGTATRTIPAPLFNALVVRDQHCRFPGCDRPAAWCEGHHVRAWLFGGPTRLSNLVLLCSRHHHLLHKPGWHAKLLTDAALEVTDPLGRVRSTTPHDPGRASPPGWRSAGESCAA
jgi:hypothetical protein